MLKRIRKAAGSSVHRDITHLVEKRHAGNKLFFGGQVVYEGRPVELESRFFHEEFASVIRVRNKQHPIQIKTFSGPRRLGPSWGFSEDEVPDLIAMLRAGLTAARQTSKRSTFGKIPRNGLLSRGKITVRTNQRKGPVVLHQRRVGLRTGPNSALIVDASMAMPMDSCSELIGQLEKALTIT